MPDQAMRIEAALQRYLAETVPELPPWYDAEAPQALCEAALAAVLAEMAEGTSGWAAMLEDGEVLVVVTRESGEVAARLWLRFRESA